MATAGLASAGGDGNIVSAKTPLAAAATAPTTNPGKFPPPNKSSQGPPTSDTNIYIIKKKTSSYS